MRARGKMVLAGIAAAGAVLAAVFCWPIDCQTLFADTKRVSLCIQHAGIESSSSNPMEFHTFIRHATWEIDSSQEVFSAITEEIVNCRYRRTWDTFFGDGGMEAGDLLLNVYGEGIPGITTLTDAGYIQTGGRIYALYGGEKAGRELIEAVYRLLLESGIEPVSVSA